MTTTLESLFESLAAVAPECPPTPAWADQYQEEGWSSANEGMIFATNERSIGTAGGGGKTLGASVSVSQETYWPVGGVVGVAPAVAHVSGLECELDVPGWDLRALAGLLLAAADLVDRIEGGK